MRNRLLATCLAAAIGWLAASGCALAATGFLAAPQVLNIPQAPFQLSTVTERSTAPAEGLVMVEVEIRNTGRMPLTRIGLQATVFTANGNPRGFFAFEMPIRLNPGITTYAVHGVSGFKADPTDRIVLLPLFAQAPAFLWRASDEQVRALDRGLVAARGDASQARADDALWHLSAKTITPQNQTPPGDPSGSGGCTDCQNAGTFCKSYCSPCYPGGLTCSCQPYNISCTCGACPPAPK